jgi:nucleotide-binding universal stress UspA family protein
MTSTTFDDRDVAPDPARVLIAVHGGEPDGWAPAVRRALGTWPTRCVRPRILATVTVPRPPFTSLLPAAARRYAGARVAWRDAERLRLESIVESLGLPTPDVVWREAEDPVTVIVDHASAWPADVLLMAADRSPLAWAGAIHHRVMRRVPCPVLLTPARPAPRRETPVLAVARGGA